MPSLHLRARSLLSFLPAAALALALAGTPGPAAAGEAVNTGYFGKVAIKGYDPVAYFTKGEAIPGSADFRHKWLGAYWHFESEEHRQLFVAAPQSYAPQYGGFCASGMGIHGGRTTDIDPEAWLIIDGKLYLNYSKETNSLITDGIVDLQRADANWQAGAAASD